MNTVFFNDFLMISNIKTVVFLLLLFSLFFCMKIIEKRKVAFSKRMIISTILGLLLGIVIQAVCGFSQNPMDIVFVKETVKWYSLFGNGFIDLIRMLVIPLIMVSIIHVIINMKEGVNIASLTKKTLIVTVVMVAISVIVGLSVGIFFKIGTNMGITEDTNQIKEITPVVDTLRSLIPSNPVKSMTDLNIISLVIVSAFFGIGAKRMSKKYLDVVKPFIDLINALQKIIMSIAMTIIKFMPYAVIALLANTIAQKGIDSIKDVGLFIVALYICVFIMFIIQLLAISLFGINPFIYLKKGVSVMVLAFTSRSSVGCLPLTIETLVDKMGVNDGTASFVAGFGTTAGMQGCAGIFPSLLLVFVCNATGTPINLTFIIMAIVVIVIGSFGIAGIPGTATMAASVALSGVGMASFFPNINPILAVDPIVDMGRTMINVTGSMTNALIVDKCLGQLDMDKFKNMQN